MEKRGHIIQKVLPDSIAEEMGLESGDAVLAINGQEIDDIFDYQYLLQDDYVEVAILAKSAFWRSRRTPGKIWGWSLRTV